VSEVAGIYFIARIFNPTSYFNTAVEIEHAIAQNKTKFDFKFKKAN
jgi:hypothetical protein